MSTRGRGTSATTNSRRLAWLCAIAALAAPAFAQSRKLNAPLAHEILGDVLDFRVTSDGGWAVYLASKTAPAPELFSAPTKGITEVIELTGPVTPTITGFELTSDGRTLVYQAGDLFSVAIDGRSPPLPLHDPIAAPGFIDSFQLSPDGRWVVYAVQLPTGGFQFQSVPVDASADPVPLSPVVANIGAHRITADSRTVVYITRGSGTFELHSASIDGTGAPSLLNGPNTTLTGLVFQISPNSRRVVYWADPRRNVFELFSAPVDGSALPVKLSGSLVNRGDVQQDFEISADSRRVVYRADRDQDELFELYSAPLNARTAPIELSGPLVAEGDVQSFRLTADAKQAVYVADQEEDGRLWLYRARIDGSAGALRVGGGPPSFLEVLDYRLSLQSDRVVYRTRSGPSSSTWDLYGASIEENVEAVRLSAGFVRAFEIGPDGQDVVLVRSGGPSELIAVPSDGNGGPVSLSALGWGSSEIAIAPGGEFVLFLAQAETYNVSELFSVPIDASSEAQKLSGALLAGAVVGKIDSFSFDRSGKGLVYRAQGSTFISPIVSDQACVVSLDRTPESLELFPWAPLDPGDFFRYAISPDGARLVFTAGDNTAEASDLYSVRLDGSQPAVMLSDPPFTSFNNGFGRFEVTPDSRTVVYVRIDDEERELYSVPIDRSTDPVRLNGPLVEGGRVSDFVLSPDGSRLVYIADQRIDGTQELFGLSLPASDDPEPLIEDPPEHTWGAGLMQMSADGERIAFLSDLVADGVFELFSLRIDVGNDPLKLNATPVAGGDVLSYAITADGKSAVYLADLESDEKRELFGAPLDGSAPPVKLSGPLAADRDVRAYEVARDGSRAVYVADEETAGVFELYSALVDGSAPRVKLSGALVAGGNLQDQFARSAFHISPMGTHVVYQADQDTDEVIELYCAPIDGSAPPIKLSGALASGGNVWTVFEPAFAISPDGEWVVFQADKLVDDVFELFAVAIDGSHGPSKLNGPLVPGGDVGQGDYELWYLGSTRPLFGFSPDSRRVVYGADQETDEAFELFESPLPLRNLRPSPAVGGR